VSGWPATPAEQAQIRDRAKKASPTEQIGKPFRQIFRTLEKE